jgi:3-hexulose-6-phosphate synthase
VFASDSLQLALDEIDLATALRAFASLGDRVRRVEVGTPLLLSAGMSAVRAVRRERGDAIVVADAKICDAGERIATNAFAAGADVVTVVGAALDSRTWEGVITAARDRGDGATVMVDAIGWDVDRSLLGDWLAAASAAAVDVELCAHRGRTGYDGEFDDLISAMSPDVAKMAPVRRRLVAGGLAPDDVSAAMLAGFDILIVGGAITASPDPVATWHAFLAAIPTTSALT